MAKQDMSPVQLLYGGAQNAVYFILRWPIFNLIFYTNLYQYSWAPIYWILARTNRFVVGEGGEDYLKFMNYGFLASKQTDKDRLAKVELKIVREPTMHHNHIRLYERVLCQAIDYDTQFVGKSMIEISCGHGGGLQWMRSTYPDMERLDGLDRCTEAKVDGCKIYQSNVKRMPIADNTYDYLLNVEASHCYADDEITLSLMRLVKPGGYMLWCDMRPWDWMDSLYVKAKAKGYILIEQADITMETMRSSEEVAEYRRRWIESNSYMRYTSVLWNNFWQMPGSIQADNFATRTWIYHVAVWQKPASIIDL